MPSPKKISIHTDRNFEIAPDVFIPLRIYQEVRNGYRATVGKKQLIFRLPHGLLPDLQQQYLDSLSDWARRTYRKKPNAFRHLLPREIPTIGSISVMGDTYRVEINVNPERNSHFGHFSASARNLVQLELTGKNSSTQAGKAVETLLSRLFVGKYTASVARRVMELNDSHFRRPIKDIRMRLTQSRWGSCSSSGNINLSSRLLLAPAPVRDAVIIHELAHLIEQNHGDRFWALVHDAMPDYKIHDRYLREKGKSLQFVLADL